MLRKGKTKIIYLKQVIALVCILTHYSVQESPHSTLKVSMMLHSCDKTNVLTFYLLYFFAFYLSRSQFLLHTLPFYFIMKICSQWKVNWTQELLLKNCSLLNILCSAAESRSCAGVCHILPTCNILCVAVCMQHCHRPCFGSTHRFLPQTPSIICLGLKG